MIEVPSVIANINYADFAVFANMYNDTDEIVGIRITYLDDTEDEDEGDCCGVCGGEIEDDGECAYCCDEKNED